MAIKKLPKDWSKDDLRYPLAWDGALPFLLAGKAVITLEAISDSSRHTYAVEQKVTYEEVVKDGKKVTEKTRHDLWFVKLLIGADNTRSYKYLGLVTGANGKWGFRTTKGTAKNSGASAENINRFGDIVAALISSDSLANKYRIWHRGFCAHCSKDLTVPSSVATGFGPTCAKKLGIPMKNIEPNLIEKLASLAD